MVANTEIGGDWITILMAIFLLVNAIWGLITGSTILFYRSVKRSEDRLLYWCAVCGSAALGIAAVLAVVL